MIAAEGLFYKTPHKTHESTSIIKMGSHLIK